jgi:hypothetical protein
MHFFQALYCLYFLFIAFLSFLLQGLTRGHCLGMVTRADSVTHWYLHRNVRLARDETPFPLAMQPKGHCPGVVTK